MYSRIVEMVRDGVVSSDRHHQSKQGTLGPSDFGGCRRRARYLLDRAPQQESPYWLGSALGTAWHKHLEGLLADDPQWRTEVRVTAALPTGGSVSGTCDLIGPQYVADHKTVGDVAWIRSTGVKDQHWVQVHLYALGAIQAGLVQEEGLTVCVAYWDRSGRQQEPVVFEAPYDPEVVQRAAQWLEEVTGAESPESMLRDEVPSTCYALCPFVGQCRGGEVDDADLASPEIVLAVRTIMDVRKEIKELERLKNDAQAKLDNLPGGVVAGCRVSWTHVPEKEVPGYTRRAYDRLSVTKIRELEG